MFESSFKIFVVSQITMEKFIFHCKKFEINAFKTLTKHNITRRLQITFYDEGIIDLYTKQRGSTP